MPPKNRFALPKISGKIFVGGALTLLVIGFVASRFLMGGTAFTLEVNVTDGGIVESSPYRLEGRVRPGDQLTLNGVGITLDLEGKFTRSWEFTPGFNTLTFIVKRPLEGERTFTYLVNYQPPAATSTFE